MKSPVARAWGAILMLLASGAGGGVARADDQERATLVINGISCPKGLRVELFADASQVQRPRAICFDDQGRLYAAEAHRWETARQDLRRFPDLLAEDLRTNSANGRQALYRKAAEAGFAPWDSWTKTADRIRVIADEDGDGRADRSGVFAGGFDDVLDGLGGGLLAGTGGLLYANAPHLWWLADADGDGVSESRKSLQDGFGVRMGFAGHGLHGLIWGPDGRIYWSVGDRGYSLKAPGGKWLHNPVEGAIFRCEPDGSKLEVFATGVRRAQELVFGEFGDLFTCESSAGAGDRSRLLYVLAGADFGWHAGHQVLLNFRDRLGMRTLSAGEGERQSPQALTAWLAEGLWQTPFESQPAWILPAVAYAGWEPAGLVFNYGGTAFPETCRGHFLLCNWGGAQSDLELFSLERAGAGFAVRNHRASWISGAENIDAEFGPDGRLYLSCVEQHGLELGPGSIYTVFDPGLAGSALVRETQGLLTRQMGAKSVVELADLLSHEDFRVRLRAQFELVRRGEEALPLFEGSVRQTLRPLRRLHAIWGLGQAARGDAGNPRALKCLVEAASDPDAEVRAQAAKALADVDEERSGRVLVSLLQDGSPRVRCFACLGVARRGLKEGWAKVLQVLETNAERDPFLRHAAVAALAALGSEEELVKLAGAGNRELRRCGLVALRRQRSAGLRAYLSDADPGIRREAAAAIYDLNLSAAIPEVAEMLAKEDKPDPADPAGLLHQKRLIWANWREGSPEAVSRLGAYASREDIPVAMRVHALRTLREWQRDFPVDPVTGLPVSQRRESRGEAPKPLLRDMAARVMEQGPAEIQAEALRFGEDLKLEIPVGRLKEWLANPAGAVPLRRAALDELKRRRTGGIEGVVKGWMAGPEAELRTAALRWLLETDAVAGMQAARHVLATGEEKERQQVIQILAEVGSPGALGMLGELLSEAASGREDPAVLWDLLQAARGRAELAGSLERYEAAVGTGKERDRYRECLAGGDPDRGAVVFVEHPGAQCQRCHRIRQTGGKAGPDLTDVGGRLSRAALLESLLSPSAGIAPGYGSAQVTLTDGRKIAGNVLKEDAGKWVIRTGEAGVVIELLKRDVAQVRPALSLMPEMGAILSKGDLRDVVAYLAEQKGGKANGEAGAAK